jgi:hypothetical protein
VKARWPFADFAVALVIVLATAGVTLGPVDREHSRTPRKLSHMGQAAKIRQLPADVWLDLLILGDSRAMPIDALALCSAIDPERRACLNSATTGGDWYSAHDLAERAGRFIDDETLVLVCLSDYWLEGGPESALELLPETWSYLDLGEPGMALASWIPLSSMRGGRMRWLHETLSDWGVRIALESGATHPEADHEADDERWARIERSNVDAWYAPTDDDVRARRRRVGERALRALTATGARVVVVNLPNPAERESYVDEHFPGRRARFRAAAHALADETGISFIDLSGRLPDRHHYRDFHHVRDDSINELIRLLAREIDSSGPRGD